MKNARVDSSIEPHKTGKLRQNVFIAFLATLIDLESWIDLN